VTTGAAEIETNTTSFSKSKRLAFLASFNPDIIAKVNEARCPLSTLFARPLRASVAVTSADVNTNLGR